MSHPMTRRRFFKTMAMSTLATLLPGIDGLIYSTKIEPGEVFCHHFTLKLPRLDSIFADYKLIHISDLHRGNTWMSEEPLAFHWSSCLRRNGSQISRRVV